MGSIKAGDRVTIDCPASKWHGLSGAVDYTISNGSCMVSIDYGPTLNFGNETLLPAGRDVTPTLDLVSHPAHYTAHPSGVECIQITEHMGFNLGNALKYIWRCDLKQDAIEDLKKARWYIDREIAKREA